MPISLFSCPSPTAFEAAPQEELDTNLSKERASRRLRSGFIVCPSATLLPSSISPSPLQTTPLHGAVTYRRQNESRGWKKGHVCSFLFCVRASGQQTFHLTSAATTTVQRQEEPINCPFLFGLSSLCFPPPTSTPHQTLIAQLDSQTLNSKERVAVVAKKLQALALITI